MKFDIQPGGVLQWPEGHAGVRQALRRARHQRRAHAANERSANAPQTVEEYASKRKHPSGCSCCGPSKPLAPSKANPHAMKGKMSGRPWMISH